MPQNYAQAAEWFRKAAAQGDASAQYNLGGMYEFEIGVPKNIQTAIGWYEKAAAQGHVKAKNRLDGLTQ